MLTWFLVIVTVVVWTSIYIWYYRTEIYQWFDNRYGPAHSEKKRKPPRRRMYD